MTTRSTRPWIKIDVDLLDHEPWSDMSIWLRGVWTTAYLLVARDGDSCRNRQRLAWLLQREGVDDADQAVQELDAAGWIEDVGDGRITIRGFRKHQLVYRGPSDLPENKSTANAGRSHHRGGRTGRDGARGGVTEERRGENTVTRPRVERGVTGREDEKPAPPSPEEANRIFKDLAERGVIGTPRILGQPGDEV